MTDQHPAERIAPDRVPRRRPIQARQWLGAAILLGVIGVVVVTTAWPSPSTPDELPVTVVKGYLGQLKLDLLEHPQIANILAERYHLRCDCTPADSLAIARDLPLKADDDFVWLGDQSQLSIYRGRGEVAVGTDNIFYSPLVFYSWTQVVDALVTAGVAQTEANGTYRLDVARLITAIEDGKTWADLGLPDLYGKVKVRTTDPALSTSGGLFAGLVANILNGGEVVDETSVQPLLPIIPPFFAGLMPSASADLFEQFMVTGMGANPMVALYESQMIEYLQRNPAQRDLFAQRVRVLYPGPTVWTSHPFAARTETGTALMRALKDPEIQRLAWELNGFRPGNPDVLIDPAVFAIAGIPAEITSVIELPSPAVMEQILAAIATPPDSAAPAPPASARLPSPPDAPSG